LTHLSLKRLGNIDHFTLLAYAQSDTKPWMKFASATFTSFLTTDSVQGDQASTKEGLLVNELSQP
jgi:hypothetical protein